MVAEPLVLGSILGHTRSDGGTVAELAKAIQLSVAPVFLLTGISSLLSLFTTRLSRIMDRTRVIQKAVDDSSVRDALQGRASLKVQKRRMYLINRAILCATVTALLVAAVVAVMFISAVAVIDVAAIVVPLFVVAMATLIAALLLFLVEVQIAISQNPRRYY